MRAYSDGHQDVDGLVTPCRFSKWEEFHPSLLWPHADSAGPHLTTVVTVTFHQEVSTGGKFVRASFEEVAIPS